MWDFDPIGKKQNNQSPKLDEFFNSQNVAQSLVRESIQNSLDASASKKPVTVNFKIREISKDKIQKYCGTNSPNISLMDHLSSPDLKKYAVDKLPEKVRCLILEDYETSGLTGTTEKDAATSGSNFVGFWWNVGITGKGKGTSGSHGVGKTTLTRSSKVSTFWAVTKRSTDSKKYHIGFSNLPYHQVNETPFQYGRFGIDSGETTDPINLDGISEFEQDFEFSREEFGLTVIIPSIHEDITSSSIMRFAVKDYYWAILNDNLKVVVEDENKTFQVSKNILVNDFESLALVLQEEKASLKNVIKWAHNAIELRSGDSKNFFKGISIGEEGVNGKKRGVLSENAFTAENLLAAQEMFDAGEMVGLRLSMNLQEIGQSTKTALLDVFVQKDEEFKSEKFGQFIRKNLVISSERTNIGGLYSCAFAIVEDQDLSDYLVLAEEPAHTNWYIGRLIKEKKYHSDWQLRFVKDSLRQTYNLLAGIDDAEDEVSSIADDIFHIVEPKGNKGSQKKQNKKNQNDGEIDEKDVKIIERKKEIINVQKMDAKRGFKLTPSSKIKEAMAEDDIQFPISLTIKAAYMVPSGRVKAFSKYSEIDFDFSSFSKDQIVHNDAVKLNLANRNELKVEILGEAFELSVIGFDGIRDVAIHTSTEM